MDRLRIAVLDDYTGAAEASADWSGLRAAHHLQFFADHLTDGDALAARLRPFDVVVLERERTPFPRALIEALPNLRLLISTGPVNWSIDFEAASQRGVVVSCTDARQDLTPELTMGLILALLRRIVVEDRGVRSGAWQIGVGTSLAGKTLGLIGLGKVGAAVAKLAVPFGMDVIAWSANLTDEAAARCMSRRVEFDELIAQSDVVSVHVVLSERSRGLIDRRALDRMKPGAFLVNTSRGPIVEEEALVDALTRGVIAGAALDVYDREPLPKDHPFRRLENVIATPHIGYITDEQCRLFYGQVVSTIAAFAAGREVRRLAAA